MQSKTWATLSRKTNIYDTVGITQWDSTITEADLKRTQDKEQSGATVVSKQATHRRWH